MLLILSRPAAAAENAMSYLAAWMAAQTNLQTWTADVTQTRSLKTLTQPLVAHGKIWFSAPNRFRWELTDPAPTIAVREADQMLILYPKLKRAERYPLRGTEAGPWKDALALLEAGFPRSQAELEARFRIVGQNVSGNLCELTLQPKAASARRLMPQIKVAFSNQDFALLATELQFADGSTMRNEFHNAQANPSLAEDLFAPRIDPDYKIVEPMKR